MGDPNSGFSNILVRALSYLGVLFLGSLLAPYQVFYNQWASAPDISISYDTKHPYFFKGKISGKDDDYFDSYYCRFKISNNSSMAAAKGCEVYLTAILHEQKDGTYIPEENFEPIKMKTYLGGPVISLRPDVSPHMALFGYLFRIASAAYQENYEPKQSGDPKVPQLRIAFCDSKHFPSWMQSHIAKGNHKLRVTTYFENREPIHLTFKVSWSGLWSENYEEMKKNLRVEKIA